MLAFGYCRHFIKVRMDARIRSHSTARATLRRNAYQTTYKREFVLKRSSSSIDEGIPPSQRFLIGSPYELDEPVGETVYKIDFNQPKIIQSQSTVRPKTSRVSQADPHKQYPYLPRRSESACDLPPNEIRQALKNQLDSTYRVDFAG